MAAIQEKPTCIGNRDVHFSLRSRHLRPSLLASSLLLAVSAQGQEKLDVDLPAAPLGQAINALAQPGQH